MIDILEYIFIAIIVALLVYFLFPNFIALCCSFGEFIGECVLNLKDAFIEKFHEWEDMFKWVTK